MERRGEEEGRLGRGRGVRHWPATGYHLVGDI